jgi:hypothetical protein
MYRLKFKKSPRALDERRVSKIVEEAVANRSFQLKKPHFIFSKNKNHIFFYIIFYSFSTKANSYLKMFWRRAFDAILLFDNDIVK